MTWQSGAIVRLQTERFDLRSMQREDVDETFLGWLADPEVMLGLNLPRRRLSRPQAVRMVLSHDNHHSFFIIVGDRTTGTKLGFFTIIYDPGNLTAETAVVIGDRNWWGKNVVVEARSALLDFIFNELGAVKVTGRPHSSNYSSIWNYKAMGFKNEAVLRQQLRSIEPGDKRLDQLIFGILKEEWRAQLKQSIVPVRVAPASAPDAAPEPTDQEDAEAAASAVLSSVHHSRAVALLAEALQVSQSEIGKHTVLGETVQWDSLAHLRLMLALEEHLGHELEIELMLEVTSLDHVVQLLAQGAGPSLPATH